MRERPPPVAAYEPFCQLAEASRDLVALTRGDGRLLYMNRAGRHALGIGECAPLTHSVLFDWLPADQHPHVRRSLSAVARGAAGSERFDVYLRDRDSGAELATAWQALLLAPPAPNDTRLVAVIARWPEPRIGRALDVNDPRGTMAKEVAALELLSAARPETSVTARLLGVVALHQRAPREYWELFERYAHLLDRALERYAYKSPADGASDELRAIAERLGSLEAGAREVADLHARALRQKIRTATTAKAQAYTAEGRLVAFELMGHLLSYYRRRAIVAPVPQGEARG